jgi:hypothetical protein
VPPSRAPLLSKANAEKSFRYYVEFGVEDGNECTTHALREKGWTGLLMDGGNENPEINLKKEFFTAENIAGHFAKYKVPRRFDHLTIDIDQNTFWVLQAVLQAGYRPRVIVTEYNRNIFPTDAFASAYEAERMWTATGDLYFGASVEAYNRLFRSFGYHLLGTDQIMVNLFAVDDGEVGGSPAITLDEVIAGLTLGGSNWCTGIHTCTNETWLEVPEGAELLEPREKWYSKLPQITTTCIEAEGKRFLPGAGKEAVDVGSPHTWKSLTCAPAADVAHQLVELNK